MGGPSIMKQTGLLTITLLVIAIGRAGISESTTPTSITELGISGTRFTINGKPTFLFGISFYGALGAPRQFIIQDLDDIQNLGINWLRVWATWAAFNNDMSAIDGKGNAREPYLSNLKWLVAECDRRGIIVDVTLSRGNGTVGEPRLQTIDTHRQAVETIVSALKPYRNWYLDLANERNIKDKRFVGLDELQQLRNAAKRIDPARLITGSHAGDITREELRDYLEKVRVDFISPHRPRNPDSPRQTETKSQQYLAWTKEIGRPVPLHYQEPFRRGFTDGWDPNSNDFVTDARAAIKGGAAGWCLHNGSQPDGRLRRSFDMRQSRLFDQLDTEEKTALRILSESFLGFKHISLEHISLVKEANEAEGTIRASLPNTPEENPLYVGWASVDITPKKPVALTGQLYKRISKSTLDPLTATALALETRAKGGAGEQAIMVSCDLLYIRKPIQERLRDIVKPRMPDFDVRKLFLNATHTHTGPGFIDNAFGDLYDVSKDEGVMKASEYGDFFLEQVANAVVAAWQNRKPAGVSWALGHAVVGMNRRAHYFDGSSVMYGNTNAENFSSIEGYEDHAVEMLFFWEPNQKLTGIVINLACTAQETENLGEISADFWHDTREEIRRRYYKDVFIFPQCATAGDISPHSLFRNEAEQIMQKRRGLSRRQEIARRIANAVDDVFSCAKADIKTELTFRHTVVNLELPEAEPSVLPFYQTDSVKPIEFHVIRLGDAAIATNPFEMYLDYGVRIKARSRAVLTFLVNLSSQHSGYLPTEKAAKAGGYSADKYIVGPEGGQVLVNETIKRINELW